MTSFLLAMEYCLLFYAVVSTIIGIGLDCLGEIELDSQHLAMIWTAVAVLHYIRS